MAEKKLLRRSEVARRLGLTHGGVLYQVAVGKLREIPRTEHTPCLYEESEVERFIAREGWTGPRFRRPEKIISEARLIKKAVKVASAMELILAGRERYEIILELRCPSSWVDDAWDNLRTDFETAQTRRALEKTDAQLRADMRAHDRTQHALERQMMRDIERRMGRKKVEERQTFVMVSPPSPSDDIAASSESMNTDGASSVSSSGAMGAKALP